MFGENLTTLGVDLTQTRIGERWRIGAGTLLLEVSAPRTPCRTFQSFLNRPRWIKTFTEPGVPGAYFRVLSSGRCARVTASRSSTAPTTTSPSGWPLRPG